MTTIYTKWDLGSDLLVAYSSYKNKDQPKFLATKNKIIQAVNGKIKAADIAYLESKYNEGKKVHCYKGPCFFHDQRPAYDNTGWLVNQTLNFASQDAFYACKNHKVIATICLLTLAYLYYTNPILMTLATIPLATCIILAKVLD